MLVKLNSLLGSNGKIRSSLVAIPDTYNIAQGQLTQIPISSLLENDYDRNDLIPLTFVSIQNVKGGNAVRNGNYIDYTHTGEIGEPTSFDYTISNSQGDMATTKVTLNVFSGIIANNDTYSVYSGYSRTINKSNILLNDSETNGNIPLVIIDIVNIVGGSVEETDTTITFTATAGAGEIAKFDYIVENSIGQQEMATVFFTVLTVPELIANTDGPYDIYAGLTYTVSKAQLLSNDSDPTNSTPLDITEVFDEINGSVIIDGNNIVFTSSGNAGDPASFKYIMSNSLGMTAQGLVEFNVLEVPPLIANTDVYEVQQGEEIIISKSSLIANDQTNFPPITFIDSINPINGTINETTNTVRFLSTGVWGQPAGFQYRITDDVANQATGNVNITILQLPPIEAYLFDNQDEFNDTFENYIPPSFEDVYTTWARYENNDYAVPPDPFTGNMVSWQYNSETDTVASTINSPTHIGFVSPDTIDNFTFEATVSSTDADDDGIGLIAAFERDGSINKSITVWRTCNGMNTWGIGPSNWCVVENFIGTNHNQISGTILASNPSAITAPPANNWSTSGVTRIRIERRGNVFTFMTSPFGSEEIDPLTEIQLDLNDFPSLSWAQEPAVWGYCNHSQNASSYTNIEFTGGLDPYTLLYFDLETNNVLEWNGTEWVITEETIQEKLGWPRQATNPITGKVYFIDENTITRIG